MAESLLAGVSLPGRVRQMVDGKPLTAAAMGPVIQGLLEQVDKESARADKAEQRAGSEHAARVAAENDRAAAVRAQADAEGGAIKERAAREAAERAAQEAATRATQMETMHREECDAHKKTMDENIVLRQQLAAAREEAKAAKEEATRVRREKPSPPQAQKPLAYDIKWTDRQGNERSMTLTPRS